MRKKREKTAKFCHHQLQRMKLFPKDIDYSTKKPATPQLRKKHIATNCMPS
jgi:hypothetical protein